MVSNQMNNGSLESEKMEANLERLRGRLPDLPIHSVMLSRLLVQLGRTLTGLLEHEIKPLGLSETEFRVLTTLFAQADSGSHPTDLCAKTSQSPANMSRISDALVSRDLITRGPSTLDRRKMVLRITEAGEELVLRLMPQLYAPLRDLFEGFSDEEQLQLVEQLKRLAANVDKALSHHVSERVE
jgi:MarR family transcriptional regulator, negative regulator of the multidrug operon emrRAB